MNRASLPVVVAISVACFLAALSSVAWRQGRARLVIEERDAIRAEILFLVDERGALNQQIRHLSGRPEIMAGAAALGLRAPVDGEFEHIPLEEW